MALQDGAAEEVKSLRETLGARSEHSHLQKSVRHLIVNPHFRANVGALERISDGIGFGLRQEVFSPQTGRSWRYLRSPPSVLKQASARPSPKLGFYLSPQIRHLRRLHPGLG